ncbi:MAG TPA: endospore germination permease, partial [Clostridia bacterium]|nr:endospore germination permease [Clostridia bacterium]
MSRRTPNYTLKLERDRRVEGGRISDVQMVFLLVTSVLMTALLFLPSIAAQQAHEDSWLTPGLAIVPGMFIGLVVSGLFAVFGPIGFIRQSETAFGAIVGKTIGMFYVWFFVYIAVLVVRQIAEFMVTLFMPDTPLIAFLITSLLVATYMARLGLEPISRVTWFLPMFVFFIYLLILAASPEMDIQRIRPILANGLRPLLISVIPASAFRGELIVAAFLLPYMTKPENGGRSVHISNITLAVVLVSTSLATVAVLGGELPGHVPFPFFSVVRLISIGRFLNRLDLVLMSLWLGGTFIKLAVYLYVATLSLAQVGNFNEYRPLVLPMAALIVGLSNLSFNTGIDLGKALAELFPRMAMWAEYAI